MAQFRTSADIFDEILQKSGEITNGNSQYEAQVKLYANKVHHAIISGGNIFSYLVDEDWKWARSKNSMVLELKPAFVTGQVTVTNGDTVLTFSSAPSDSKAGWYLQFNGYRTVYRITSHTAGVVTAALDSAVLQNTGTYNFRCFKLDYEVFPSYLYVDSHSDKISFEETASTSLTATLTHGSYTPTGLINHVVDQLNAIGASVYTGSYDNILKQFTISSDRAGGAGIFTLLGASGASIKRSALPLLGFDLLDTSDAASFESTYIINGVSRLIAPFKIFTGSQTQPFIKSLDPETLEEQYPVSIVEERAPTNFAVVEERADGTYVVRFSSYPSTAKKATLDWVPVPIDLQDNAASIPRIPRKDLDVLIHGACAFVLYDKEDTKWKEMYGMCKTGLEAMQKRNRSELFRTGENFAQIVPRQDLMTQARKLKYGYEYSGPNQSVVSTTVGAQMVPISLPYTAFQTGSGTVSITARSLPENRFLQTLILKHSIAFVGTGITALTADVGINGDLTRFIQGFDLLQAVADSAQDSMGTTFFPAASTDIIITLTATGSNLNSLTAGNLKLYFQEVIVEA